MALSTEIQRQPQPLDSPALRTERGKRTIQFGQPGLRDMRRRQKKKAEDHKCTIGKEKKRGKESQCPLECQQMKKIEELVASFVIEREIFVVEDDSSTAGVLVLSRFQ